jgi:hypothetical protein
MMTFAELALMLERSAAELPALLLAEHEHNALTIAAEAAEYIGHELPEWPPLAPSTVEQKQRLGYVGRISATDPLLRTGEMERSIEGRADADGFVIGSSSKIALYQEMGTSRIPPRPFMALAMQRNIEHLAERYDRLGVRILVPAGTRMP